MLTILLRRNGKKKKPIYSIVVNQKQKVKGKNFIEKIGTYYPNNLNEKYLIINLEKLIYWKSKGAKSSYNLNKVLNNIKKFI